MKITKSSILKKILEKKGSEKILAKHNVPCVFCPMAKFEIEELKIGEVCEMYGIEAKKLLKDLNK